ncbi:MAG TPA: DUF362 domain-containing protein [Bacteroidales bacterium]|nr:DUF362 domain-containing protein [Bacteroidales bacterium]
MKRRDFIRNSAGLGVLSGALLSMGRFGDLMAAENYAMQLPYDFVAIKGGEAAAMFDKGIASLGGMKQFVKANQTVVIKPNIGWDSAPERAANTNPQLVGRIVEQCKMAGAKTVYVFDNTCAEESRCYKLSGIEEAVKKAGGTMVSGRSQSYYQDVTLPRGKKLKNARVHELILESDVFINVPTLKNHGGAALSVCMKNMMGIVWDREYWHGNDLHQCIADFAAYRKPDLNVVDAFRVLKRNGPRGVSVADVVTMKYQLIGKDMVALDTASAKVFGIEPAKVKHIGLAEQLGAGSSNIEAMKVNRITMGA